MYARVVTFEGATDVDGVAKQIQENGRPEGVPATAFYMLADRDSGKVYGLTLFDSEEDMRAGDEAMNAMTPPTEGLGRRSSVELCEVVAQMRA